MAAANSGSVGRGKPQYNLLGTKENISISPEHRTTTLQDPPVKAPPFRARSMSKDVGLRKDTRKTVLGK